MSRLEVITGPMYSGKSEELLRRLRRLEIAGNHVIVLKPEVDDRYGIGVVSSHSGVSMEALNVANSADIRLKALGYDAVGVDEVQFFDEEIVPTLRELSRRQIVIATGLDMTYRAEPFGQLPILLAVADRIDKLTAVCHRCGKDATLTQRLINGKPAPFSGPTVQVGGLETYEARCRRCFQPG